MKKIVERRVESKERGERREGEGRDSENETMTTTLESIFMANSLNSLSSLSLFGIFHFFFSLFLSIFCFAEIIVHMTV